MAITLKTHHPLNMFTCMGRIIFLAGWRGFDPSGKGLIDERYLTLVSSSKSNLTSVITGNFIGKNNLANNLNWEIRPIEINI